MSTPTERQNLINSLIIDNNTGQISPAKMREVLTSLNLAIVVTEPSGVTAVLPLLYNIFTNQFSMSPATALQDGYLTKEDFVILLAKENTSNKQNSLALDGTGIKFPTADAVNYGLSLKLDASAYNNRFKGKYTSLVNLETAHPTANSGDYAQVDEGSGFDVINYNYDLEDGWIDGGSGSAATNTDMLPEGSTNLYWTTARVLATILTEISFATGGAIVSTDSVLVAFGKLQKQINDILTAIGLKENTSNKQNSLATDGTGVKFPTVDATNAGLATKQNTIINPVTGIGATGQVSFWAGTNAQAGNGSLFWDAVNKRLGVSTSSTPLSSLDIGGSDINLASSGLGRGIYFHPTVTATANNNVLVGLDLNPTFDSGAFTGVNQVAMRVSNRPVRFEAGATLQFGTTNQIAPINVSFNASASIIYASRTDGTQNASLGYTGGGRFYFNSDLLIGTAVSTGQRLQVEGTTLLNGAVTLGVIPTTSTGTPNILTQPTAGGNIEKIPYTAFTTPLITITTDVSITTATTDSGGLRQNGRHVVISNGANAINITCNGGVTASYGKVGSEAITFVQGSGRTLVQLSGTAVLNGIAGSEAKIWSNGTTDYLTITNY
jgi:hypothetical protein